MKDIKQADVKHYLETYYTDNSIGDDLKEAFDYIERNKHKNNFHKLFEDYLEDYNKKLLKNGTLLRDHVVYEYERVKQYNSELIETEGRSCNNKYHYYINYVNSINENYKFLGLDTNVICDCINKKISLFLELFLKYSKKLNLNIEIEPILNMSDDESYIFGRIYTENEMNISESNIILEGNMKWNNGDKAQLLNLTDMRNICFFLGQILAIKGKKEINQFSIKYYVSNVYAGLPSHLKVQIDKEFVLKHFNTKEIEEDSKIHENILHLYNNENIHIMICNGYIYNDNNYSDNLDNFLKVVNEKLPHVVLIFWTFFIYS